jgi:tetratricopeptide (TPR) repeat protein
VVKVVIAVALLAMLGTMTHARASLWGNQRDQALLWAKLNPGSPRAQANAAQAETNAGRPDLSIQRLRPELAKAPDQVQLALNLLAAECAQGHIDDNTLVASRTALATTRDPGSLLTSWFERAIGQIQQPPCAELTLDNLQALLDATGSNRFLMTNPGRHQDVEYLKGRIALARGDASQALTHFNRALDLQVRPGSALQQAALLGASGFPQQGLAHLDHYASEQKSKSRPGFGMSRLHAWVLERQNYWPNELQRIRKTLQEDANAQARPSKTSG